MNEFNLPQWKKKTNNNSTQKEQRPFGTEIVRIKTTTKKGK